MKQKILILLVGQPGVGKTTFCSSINYDVRISQDDQGKVEHLNLYKRALKMELSPIVIDRMNFNKEQRKRYLEPAKLFGYTIMCYEFPSVVLRYPEIKKNVANRKHPTLHVDKLAEVTEFYWKKYEKPEFSEGFDYITEVRSNEYYGELSNASNK
jgi:predicted kinase